LWDYLGYMGGRSSLRLWFTESAVLNMETPNTETRLNGSRIFGMPIPDIPSATGA